MRTWMGVDYETKVARLKTWTLREALSPYFAEGVADLDAYVDSVTMNLILTLQAKVMCGELRDSRQEPLSYEIPTSWWQHVKMQFGWGRPKYRTVTIPVTVEEHYHVCPHLASDQGHIRFLMESK